jgi:hypothetical protein
VLVVAGGVVAVPVVLVLVGVLAVCVGAVIVCVAVVCVVVGWVAVVAAAVVVVADAAQSRCAWMESGRTASTRLDRSVGLIVAGSPCTSVLNLSTALDAAPQFPADTAELTWSRSADSPLAWLPSSRPEVLPQATSSEAAKPSPQAKMARGTWRMRSATLLTEREPLG